MIEDRLKLRRGLYGASAVDNQAAREHFVDGDGAREVPHDADRGIRPSRPDHRFDGSLRMMAYSVSQRTAEIGIRVALGARTGDVVALVMRESVAIVGVGLAIGLPAAYATSRMFASLLFGVRPTDLLTWLYRRSR
jgi:FtsX-like permease family protein